MGLDVDYFKNVRRVDCLVDEDGEPLSKLDGSPIDSSDYCVRAYANPDFPGRADGVEDRAWYLCEEEGEVRSGGYGGYNAWREQLAKLAGYEEAEHEAWGVRQRLHAASAWAATSGPFWELIMFSDCEGTIGPVVSTKLAKDFADYDERAKAIGGRFYEEYESWRDAFAAVAGNGFVNFH